MMIYLLLPYQQKMFINTREKRSDNKNYWFIAGLSVVVVVAIVSPLDGPLGDVATIGALSGALSQ